MNTDPFTKAEFPVHWAGVTKDGIFVCGACPHPEVCLAETCTRADADAWKVDQEKRNLAVAQIRDFIA
jgi:hypothetical protein